MVHMLAIFGFCVTVCVACKRKFEVVLPATALLVMLLLTPLGMLQRLSWVDGLSVFVLIGIAALLLTALLSKRISISTLGKRMATYVLTPGFVCFLCVTVFWLYACEPMVVWRSDDIVHWALEPRVIGLYNGLPSAVQRPSLYFATYTPGIPLLHWFAMHMAGEWLESVLYASLYIFNAILLLPLLQKLTWRRFYLIPVALVGLVLFPAWGNVFSYVFLGVDTTQGLCLGYVFITGLQLQKRDDFGMLSLALGLCGLVLMKQIGLLFAAMALLILLLMGRLSAQGRLRTWLCAVSPFVTIGCWLLYCHIAGLSGHHSSNLGTHLSELLAGAYVPPKGIEGVLPSLIAALTGGYVGPLTLQTAPVMFMPKLVWLAVLALVPLFLQHVYPARSMRRLSICLAVCTLLYIGAQYISFFVLFYEETPIYVGENALNMFVLMERYMAPLMLGFTVLDACLLLFVPSKPRTKRSVLCRTAMAVCFSAIFALTLNWSLLYETLVPDRYCQQDRAIGAEAQTLMDHDWAYVLQDYENAHVLVGLDPDTEYIHNFQYTFPFAKFELPKFDYITNADTLSNYLLGSGVTHVICFDDTAVLYPPASALVADGTMYTWTLYEVTDDNGHAVLVEYY